MATITINMHQRTATDGERTTSNYVLVDTGTFPELLTPRKYEREGWEPEHCPVIAVVVVEHPEIMWGSSDEVLGAFRRAAWDEAERLGLITLP